MNYRTYLSRSVILNLAKTAGALGPFWRKAVRDTDRRPDILPAVLASHVTTSIHANLTSGDSLRKRRRPLLRRLHPPGVAARFWPFVQDRRRRRCLRPRKVSGPDLTKMFHVKHFGLVEPAANQPSLVGLRSSHSRLALAAAARAARASAPCREVLARPCSVLCQ